MNIHFETRAAAINHLGASGWRESKNGNWVSEDGSCAAHILIACGDVVLVQFWEIAT